MEHLYAKNAEVKDFRMGMLFQSMLRMALRFKERRRPAGIFPRNPHRRKEHRRPACVIAKVNAFRRLWPS